MNFGTEGDDAAVALHPALPATVLSPSGAVGRPAVTDVETVVHRKEQKHNLVRLHVEENVRTFSTKLESAIVTLVPTEGLRRMDTVHVVLATEEPAANWVSWRRRATNVDIEFNSFD